MDNPHLAQLSEKDRKVLNSGEAVVYAMRPLEGDVSGKQHVIPLLLLTDQRILLCKETLMRGPKIVFEAGWIDVNAIDGEPGYTAGRIRFHVATTYGQLSFDVPAEIASEVESAVREGYNK